MASSNIRSIIRIIVVLLMGGMVLFGLLWGQARGSSAQERQLQRYRERSLDLVRALDVEVLEKLTYHRENQANKRLEGYLSSYAHTAEIPLLYTLIEQDGLIFRGPAGGADKSLVGIGLRELLPLSGQQDIVYTDDRLAVITPVKTAQLKDITLYLVFEQDNRQLTEVRLRAYLVPAVISVLVLCSLALLLVLVLRTEKPLFQYAEVVSLGVILLVITGCATWAVYDWEVNDLEQHFRLTADIKASFLADDLQDLQEKLDGLGRFYEGSIFVDPWEFEAYAHPLPWDGLTISWQWIPSLDQEGYRQAAALMEQFADIHLDIPEDSLERPYLIYAEPLDTARHFIGWDVSSEPVRDAALREARATDMFTVTSLHQLAETSGQELGAVVFRPVRRSGAYIGSLAAVFSYDQFIQGLFYQHRRQRSGITVSLYQVGMDGTSQVLTKPAASSSGLTAAYPLFLFGNTYELRLTADKGSGWGDKYYITVNTLITGLLVSLLLIMCMYLLTQWRTQLTRRVNIRTREAIDAHKRVREILDSLDTCVFVTDLSSRGVLFQNQACRRLTGELNSILQNIFPAPSTTGREYTHGSSGRVFLCSSRSMQWAGGRMVRLETAREITKEKRTLEELYSIEWMLSAGRRKTDALRNRRTVKSLEPEGGEIADAVGFDTLDELVGDIMDLTDSSCGVYAQDGTCCYFMEDPVWTGLSGHGDVLRLGVSRVLKSGLAEHISVSPHVGYAVYPVFAGREIAGALHLGWGNPPEVREYRTRPPYILDLARQRGKSSARLIGEILERHRLEKHRERLQQELLHTQKIESVGRLAGGVAHDFNNMLGVILGYTDLCIEYTQHDSTSLEYLQQIKEAAERSSELTRQLLTFARKQPDQVQIIHLETHISAILTMLKRLIGEHVQVTFSPEESIWPVQADPSQIDQVLINLCTNAADSLDTSGGRIDIMLRNRTISPDDTVLPEYGEYVELSVSDNGSGISEDKMEHLFDPFYTTKELGKGTGLGLSTVYGIVTRYQGRITVDSTLGKGSTFTVFLPKRTGEEVVTEEHDELLQGAGEFVLVVEDQQSVRRFVTSALRTHGYRVLSAADARLALEVLVKRCDEIDMVISDVVMPGMDGVELKSRIHKLYPGIKVLLISGYPDGRLKPDDAETELLEKPFSVSVLLRRVKNVLDLGS